jgi:hypothetical protein
MAELARSRLGPAASIAEFVTADIFDWQPVRRHDVVVFCFWISHVPDARLDEFLETVAASLTDDGTAFFVDAQDETTSQAVDHGREPGAGEVQLRRLNDGREFRIVKNYWTTTQLVDRFAAVGLHAEVRDTATFFRYGRVRRNDTGRRRLRR